MARAERRSARPPATSGSGRADARDGTRADPDCLLRSSSRDLGSRLRGRAVEPALMPLVCRARPVDALWLTRVTPLAAARVQNLQS